MDGESGERRKKPRSTRRLVIEWVILVAGALLIALVIKTFLFQAFWIPSESMLPTLEKGDRVLVNKVSYRLHDVHQGDIVVFDNPVEGQGEVADLVKRVIAVGGQTLVLRDGAVYVDGEKRNEDYTQGVTAPFGTSIPGCANPRPQADKCEVPPGSVFVMGDNRQASQDSRRFGPIDEDRIVGRVFVLIWPPGRIDFL
jgi:signal peptidase I